MRLATHTSTWGMRVAEASSSLFDLSGRVRDRCEHEPRAVILLRVSAGEGWGRPGDAAGHLEFAPEHRDPSATSADATWERM